MLGKPTWQFAAITLMVVTVSASALAQVQDSGDRALRLSGLINDHTAQLAGAWEIHGQWSMSVSGDSGSANFSAILTMERSDLYVLTTGDPTRTAHTHHITLANATVAPIAGGFEVTGLADITANGNPAPLPPPLQLTIDITGGTELPYSNIKITFGGGAANHFGTQALSGVVRFIHDGRGQ